MINAEHLSMIYQMPADRALSIKEYFIKRLKRQLRMREFRALDDVSFSLHGGEVLGVIGRNGAGKSTLLKLVSGILKPTSGTLVCEGRIVPMLELGSGLDFDLTGRENIFLSGAILGYSKAFLEKKYDDIVAFSELSDFIDVPMRNYSSGMMMRLAFSVASLVEPDILIVDEILAVGDEPFQKKSRARMKELICGGTTALFVSHDLGQIRELCDHVLWLDHGKAVMMGKPEEVCGAYQAFVE